MLKKSFWLFFITGTALQITWYGLLWVGMVTWPNTLKTTDFSIFYTAGRIAASGHYDLVYDIQTQRQVQAELLGKPIQTAELLPFNHPPLLVSIQQLVSTQNYTASYLRWDFLMACFLAVTALVISHLFQTMKWERGPRNLALISSLLFYPIFVSLLKGQDTAFLLLGVALWVLGMITKKDALAGIGLAMTAIRPQIAIMLGLPHLFNRRGVLGWAALAGIVHLVSFLPLGLDGSKKFLEMLLVSARGEGFYINRSAMFNLIGMLVRFFPQMDTVIIQAISWGAFLLAIVFLCVLWAKSREIRFRHISLALVLCLFAAPHLHYHDLAVLLLPILCLVLSGVAANRLTVPRAVALPMAISVILLLSELWDPARFSIPYLLMLLLPVLSWRMEKSHETG